MASIQMKLQSCCFLRLKLRNNRIENLHATEAYRRHAQVLDNKYDASRNNGQMCLESDMIAFLFLVLSSHPKSQICEHLYVLHSGV